MSVKDELLEKAQEEYARGRQAEDVLNSAAYKRAQSAVKEKAFYDLINTKWWDRKLREEIYRRLKTESLIEQALKSEVQNGNVAKKRLEAN